MSRTKSGFGRLNESWTRSNIWTNVAIIRPAQKTQHSESRSKHLSRQSQRFKSKLTGMMQRLNKPRLPHTRRVCRKANWLRLETNYRPLAAAHTVSHHSPSSSQAQSRMLTKNCLH